jgi:serine/threonine protein kinase
MGAVWWGRDRATGRLVAVKLLHEQFAADPAMLTRFVRERTVLVGLRHPNLVPVHDMIMEGDRLALIMDLVQGTDLHRYLHAHGPLAPELAATLIAQVCEALAVVHAAGVIHRDLKPGNILLDTSQPVPIARLTDFGLAWTAGSVSLTSHNMSLGTPAYFAPEVVTGQRGGPAADLYGAATSLYELLVGRPPFAGGPATAIMWRQVDAEPLRPPAIPELLWRVIAKCLEKDPTQRPDAATTARLLRDCLPALRGRPAAAPLPAGAVTFALSEPTARAWETRAEPHPSGPLPSRPRPSRPRPSGPHPSGPPSSGRFRPSGPAHAKAASARRRRRPATRITALAIGLLLIIGTGGIIGARFLAHGHQAAGHQATGHQATGHQATGHRAAPRGPRVLYSFRDGTTDGWRAGANVASVAAVTSFADGPGHPFGGAYALDGSPADGAPIPVPRMMMITPLTPLNLSAARTFYLYVDGFGYAPFATGYAATVTLTSRSHTLTRTVRVRANTWNRVAIRISSWMYRDHVTGISVGYTGMGSDTPWFPHFQIDDVGYTT